MIWTNNFVINIKNTNDAFQLYHAAVTPTVVAVPAKNHKWDIFNVVSLYDYKRYIINVNMKRKN
jgi:hypothetical protein